MAVRSTRSGDLPRIVGNTKPGQKVTLQVYRRGAYKDVNVTVVEFDPPTATAGRRSNAPENGKSTVPMSALGLAVSDLTEAQKRELKLKSGVRVDAIEGAAARAGLREGDVILAWTIPRSSAPSSSVRRLPRSTRTSRSRCWSGAANGSITW